MNEKRRDFLKSSSILLAGGTVGFIGSRIAMNHMPTLPSLSPPTSLNVPSSHKPMLSSEDRFTTTVKTWMDNGCKNTEPFDTLMLELDPIEKKVVPHWEFRERVARNNWKIKRVMSVKVTMDENENNSTDLSKLLAEETSIACFPLGYYRCGGADDRNVGKIMSRLVELVRAKLLTNNYYLRTPITIYAIRSAFLLEFFAFSSFVEV